MRALLNGSILLLAAKQSAVSSAQLPAGSSVLPSREIIAERVHTGDPRDLSWAAVDALKINAREFPPAFQSLAERWEALPHHGVRENGGLLTEQQRGRRDAMAAVLDLIVQWHGSLSPEALRNLSDDFRAAAITLLAHMPVSETTAILTELYSQSSQSSWYTERAAASLLAQQPTTELVASLLKHITVDSYVSSHCRTIQVLGSELGGGAAELRRFLRLRMGGPKSGAIRCGTADRDRSLTLL